MGVNEATVRTLTAEVKVIAMGARQVTLSVYRQLDEVPLVDVEPMGRVNVERSLTGWVVGRHRADGTLVKAKFMPYQWGNDPDIENLPGEITVCPRAPRATDPDWFRLSFAGRSIYVNVKSTRDCGIESHRNWRGAGEGCAHWSPNDQEAALHDAIARWDARRLPHLDAKDLPLIVLAGLR